MFQRILVPLDGSTRAESAVPVAARLAQSSGGSVILLHVAVRLVSPGKPGVPEVYPVVGIDEMLAEANEHLKILARSDMLSGITTEVQTLVGAVAPTILAAAQALHADLIVLCSHGLTGVKRWTLGSVAHKLYLIPRYQYSSCEMEGQFPRRQQITLCVRSCRWMALHCLSLRSNQPHNSSF